MRFESYAQEWEDLILYVVLKDIKNGFYIDVGANDPIEYSVTKFFYEEGWNGINIEPLRSKCMLLQEKRTRDINLCIGIGSKEEKLPLVPMGMESTFSLETINKTHQLVQKRFVKAIFTLSDIYEQYCGIGQDIHFCKIDVEGFEKSVLEGINNWNTFRPWIYVIESAFPGTVIPCYERWENILLKHGYLLGYRTKINRYYVDERREYLLDRFGLIKEFIDNNEIVKIRMESVDNII